MGALAPHVCACLTRLLGSPLTWKDLLRHTCLQTSPPTPQNLYRKCPETEPFCKKTCRIWNNNNWIGLGKWILFWNFLFFFKFIGNFMKNNYSKKISTSIALFNTLFECMCITPPPPCERYLKVFLQSQFYGHTIIEIKQSLTPCVR